MQVCMSGYFCQNGILVRMIFCSPQHKLRIARRMHKRSMAPSHIHHSHDENKHSPHTTTPKKSGLLGCGLPNFGDAARHAPDAGTVALLSVRTKALVTLLWHELHTTC